MKYSASLQDCAFEFEIYDGYDQERSDEAAAASVVLDITSSESFDKARIWIKELQIKCRHGIVIALAGNKMDMKLGLRVTTADGNSPYFVEISVKTIVEGLHGLIAERAPKL